MSTTIPTPASNAYPALAVRRLHPMSALPAYQTAGSAGLDLAACIAPEGVPGAITIEPGRIVPVPTGLAIAVPPGFEAQVRPRSGLATKHGLTLPNTPGTIDSDYRGEVIVPLINLGQAPVVVTHGMRVAQMVIAPVAQARIVEVPELDDTTRGSGGFGSTGH